MQTLSLGRLKVRVFRSGQASGSQPPLVVVLAHGFGAAGDDLVGLAEVLDVPAGTVLVFPEALHSMQTFVGSEAGNSRAWWMIDVAALQRAFYRREVRDLTRQVPEGLAEARAAMTEFLGELGGIVPLDRLVLGGFSQGAMLTLDVALRDPTRKVTGIIHLSGTFLAEHEWTPLLPGRSGMPVFQSHGSEDPVLPMAIAEKLRDAMTAAKLEVTFDPFRGGHTIPLETAQRLGAWLRSLP